MGEKSAWKEREKQTRAPKSKRETVSKSDSDRDNAEEEWNEEISWIYPGEGLGDQFDIKIKDKG